jgi:predicted dehydrogenase
VSDSRLGFGVVGLGYWGPNLVRNLVSNPRADVLRACDLREERTGHFGSMYPSIEFSPDPSALLDDARIGAIVITTPVSTHFQLALDALHAGKHVLVAKPLAASSSEAEELGRAAKEAGRVLMVDHTFVYTPVVERIRECIAGGELGEVYYFDSVRVNLGLYQPDVNVVWDLAAHDFSILLDVIAERPDSVLATGARRASGSREDIAYISVAYPSGLIAHLHVSWLSPVKIRKTLIGGSENMLVWDDLESDEKLKIYDRGVSLPEDAADGQYRALVDYRAGDISIPYLDRTEALTKEIGHFIDCVEGAASPRSGAASGLEVVRLLEASEKSISQGGTRVHLGIEGD